MVSTLVRHSNFVSGSQGLYPVLKGGNRIGFNELYLESTNTDRDIFGIGIFVRDASSLALSARIAVVAGDKIFFACAAAEGASVFTGGFDSVFKGCFSVDNKS